jgi:hypothetical protein
VIDTDAPRHVTVGVAGRVSASLASTAQLVFAQLYETLVRVDCNGRAAGGLADAWSSTDGRTWTFLISSGATFSDGVPVTAQSVMQAWSTTDVQRLASVTAASARELRVTLRDSADVGTFALPMFAVGRRTVDEWPTGTSRWIIDPDAPPRTIRLLARTPDVHTPDTITVRTFPDDPRAALDAGVDILLTRDARALEYASALSDYAVTPLGWSSTYVLATRPGQPNAPAHDRPDEADLISLARHAVGGDARPVTEPAWQCVVAPTSGGGSGSEILYDRDDDTARAIAERITALAWPRERAPSWLTDRLGAYASAPRVRAVAGAALPGSGRRGALAVIAALPRTREAIGDPCGSDTRGVATDAVIPTGWQVTPLVDVRAQLIHRSAVGRVTVNGSGMIRFGVQ